MLKFDFFYLAISLLPQLHREMARWAWYQQLLLVLFIPLCESAEYYIRPTTLTTNTSCPGQPCLTLNQYTTGYHIQSNTVLNFLPGKHVLKRPLLILNVENVTLKSSTAGINMHAQLAAKFSCENDSLQLKHCIYKQSAINLINATNVVINDISLEMWAPNVSGVIMEQSTHIHLQLDIHYVQGNTSHAIGVLANETNYLYMDRLRAGNLYYGIRIENTNNIHITNSAIENSGVMMNNNDTLGTFHTISSADTESGMYLESCSSVSLKNISVIKSPIGMLLKLCSNTTLTSIHATSNQRDGMQLRSCSNTSLTSIYATNNQRDGMYLISCSNIALTSIYATNNEGRGVHLDYGINTTWTNIYAANNQADGIYIHYLNLTNIFSFNLHQGLFPCRNINMTNISVTKNQMNGMNLYLCSNINMKNVSATNNELNGIHLELCNNTILTDISSMNNNRIIESCINPNKDTCNGADVMHSEILLKSDSNIRLEDCVFSDIAAISTRNVATEPRSVLAVIEINNSSLIMSDCTFTRNNITSIKAIGSNIKVEGEIVFLDNQASSGAALLFASNSVLVISDTSSVIFQNNHAFDYGGAIYILTDEFYSKSMTIRDIFQLNRPSLVTPSTRCFLSVEGKRSQARLLFTNNTADKGGDVIYGGLVALGYDGDWNCLLSFKNISDMSQQNGLSVITSGASRICLCRDGQPDCLTVADPTMHSIYPGQTITLPVVVVGQDFGTVSGSVIAQFLQGYTTCSIHLEEGQRSRVVDNGKCTDLDFTLYTSGSENCTATLALKTSNAEVLEPMNTDDNHKLNNSWAILNENPNYHELALRLLFELGSRILSQLDLHLLNTEGTSLLYEFFSCPLFETTLLSYNSSNSYIDILKEDFLKFTLDISTIGICNIARSVKFVFPKEIYTYPTFVNLSFQSCPLGFALSRKPPFKCDCNHLLQLMPQVTCNIQHRTITRDGLVWVGIHHGNGIVAASKYCPYNYCKSMHTEITLTAQESDPEFGNHSTTDFQCNHQHSGVLCGGCQSGLSVVLGTNRCLSCSNVYISLILPFAMAGLLLVFFIKLLDLTISQGTMNELVFYVNIISANKHLYYGQTSVNPMTLFIAWFNLDIGIETCFFNGLTAYTRTWLQFVFPLYIWAIAGLIIIIAKYSDRVAKVMGNNGVPVLATLFLLSYAKLFNTIITAMSYTTLYTTQGQKLVWSADGNLDYLGPKHIPLFCVAVAALVFLWFPYTLLLLLGQWLYKLDCRLITRMLLNLKPFLDAHFAAFKDKHRYWFGFLLLVRAAHLLISASIIDNTTEIVEFSTAVLCILLTFWAQKVYCCSSVGTFGTAFLLNLSIMNVTKLFSDNSYGSVVVSFTLIAIALTQFLGLILYKVVIIVKHSHRMTACCGHKNRLNDDSWVLYEQAALERNLLESGSEAESVSDMNESTESVPTYGI